MATRHGQYPKDNVHLVSGAPVLEGEWGRGSVSYSLSIPKHLDFWNAYIPTSNASPVASVVQVMPLRLSAQQPATVLGSGVRALGFGGLGFWVQGLGLLAFGV